MSSPAGFWRNQALSKGVCRDHRVVIARAVASLEEAEGHQHLAGEHEGGCE